MKLNITPPEKPSSGHGDARARGRPRKPGESVSEPRVQAVERAITLIRLLSEEVHATLKVVCADTGLPAATAHRILETLRAHRIVDYDETNQTWSIGVETFRVGQGYVQRMGFLDVGRSVMHQLTEATGETSNIAVFDDWSLIHVSQVETQAPIRAFIPSGTRSHLHASGSGKAVLAWMPRPLVRDHMVENALPRYTTHTLVTVDDLLDDLDLTQTRGWAFDNEERHLGMRCIAAPIFNSFGEAIAGISISGPISRLTDARVETLASGVIAAAHTVTEKSGGKWMATATAGERKS